MQSILEVQSLAYRGQKMASDVQVAHSVTLLLKRRDMNGAIQTSCSNRWFRCQVPSSFDRETSKCARVVYLALILLKKFFQMC